MKKYSILLLIVLQNFTGFGQGGTQTSGEDFMKNLTPPTPNTASLGLYGEVPLNEFTGNPQISIPLYNVKSKTIEIPISLSYSSDGIKVDQYESNVGMGWVLNCNGAIIRQVFDYPDNFSGRMQKPNTALNSPEMAAFLQDAANAPAVDTQPDIFVYNIGGVSGKFFLDNNNVPVEVEPSGNKIEITNPFLDPGGENNSPDPEIIITDIRGVKYFFGGLNAVESSYTRRLDIQGPNPPSQDTKTAWYLTRILDTNSNDEVLFSYSLKHHTYITGNDQNLIYEYANDSNRGSVLKNYKTESHSYEAVLDEILFSGGKIKFNYSKRTTDTDFSLLKLDSMVSQDSNGIIAKKTDFIYTQYVASSYTNQYNATPAYLRKRFFLTELREYSNNLNPIKHTFEYYAPENLPVRFAFSQDTYGVFNGRSNGNLFSNRINIPNSVVTDVLNGALADRSPNSNVGYYGLLKKITYPTGGYAELQYEPHVYGTRTVQIFPPLASAALDVRSTNFDDATHSSTDTLIIHSSIDQDVIFSGSVGPNNRTADDCHGFFTDPDDFHIKAFFRVKDLTTNQDIPIYTRGLNSDGDTYVGTSWTFTTNPNTLQRLFKLQANKDYEVKLNASFACIIGSAGFRYYSQPITETQVPNEIGGYRVSKIIKSGGQSPQIERYFYSSMDCLSCQSGHYIAKVPEAYIKVTEKNNPCNDPYDDSTIYNITSSTLSLLYSAQNVQFGYEYVTKSFGDAFENGGIESQYLIVQDGLPATVMGAPDPTTPFTNGFNSGKLSGQKVFRKNGDGSNSLVKEISNTYFHDTSKDFSVKGYSAFKSNIWFAIVGTGNGFECIEEQHWNNYSLSEYNLRSQWHYLKDSQTKEYFDNSEITNTVSYNYDNPTHLQLSSQETESSTGTTLLTKYFYPQDSQITDEPHISELIAKNMIGIPIVTESYRNGDKLSEQKIVYNNWGSSKLLPQQIQTAKGYHSPDTRLVYNSYDDSGHPIEIKKESGMVVSFIWGYNKTQLIAKIENASNAQITAALGINIAMANETNMTAINNLRSTLSNAMITTYSYTPLVGINTVTDPKGDVTTYSYDGFGRLKGVRDNEGNLLSENEYNFKTQN